MGIEWGLRLRRKTMSRRKKKGTSAAHKFLSVLGVVMCVVLIPVLVINVALIVKSYTNTEEVPMIGGYCPLIVMTGSMEPEIMSGDLIFVKQIEAGDVQAGDIIAFFDPDGNGTSIVTHRVVEVLTGEEDGALSFQTRGDANNTEDRLPVPAENVVGAYLTRIPKAGHVAMFMQTTAGLIVCVFLPLVLLVVWDVLRRRGYEKRNRQDTDALLKELEALRAAKAAEQAKAKQSGEDAPE